MRAFFSASALSAATFGLLGTALAQDAMQGHADALDLPEACETGGRPPAMPSMAIVQSAMENMTEASKEAMQGMMQTQEPMMQGMMAEDPDLAFACGMIPHHTAAIKMAEVELEYGDSDQMQQMARKIIEDQKQEIAELTKWIEEQAQ